MKTRNKEPAERAITNAALVGGLSLRQVRKLLRDAGFEPVSKSSWEILQRVYLPAFQNNLKLMGECIFRPRKMTDLGLDFVISSVQPTKTAAKTRKKAAKKTAKKSGK